MAENKTGEEKFEIRFSANIGRYLVAKKDLHHQELIIEEAPLIIAPSGKFDWDQNVQRHLPICIGCLKSETFNSAERFGKCSLCTWPRCHLTCPGFLQVGKVYFLHTSCQSGLLYNK